MRYCDKLISLVVTPDKMSKLSPAAIGQPFRSCALQLLDSHSVVVHVNIPLKDYST